MTRIAKLYEKMMARRPLSFAEFCALLEAFGYHHIRTNGSHQAFRNVVIRDTRIVQPNGKAAKPYQVKQFLDMIEAFGLTMGE